MEPRDRIRFPCSEQGLEIVVTDDGSRTLIDLATQSSFHSLAGAVAETYHVYVKPWRERASKQPKDRWRILEMGFGTGLGWLMSAMSAGSNTSPCQLEFVSLEHRLLSHSVLDQLDPLGGLLTSQQLGYFPMDFQVDESVVAQTWAALSMRRPGDVHVDCDLPHAKLRIELGEATTVCPRIADVPFDILYWDPFAPETSSELWDEAFLQSVLRRLSPDGCLLTYCVSGLVRRRFESLGWRCQRVAGPPRGKRQVMIVQK